MKTSWCGESVMVDPDALYSILQAELKSDDLPSHVALSTNVQEAARFQMNESFLKKFREDVSSDADEKAVELFLEENSECGSWTEVQLEDSRDEMLFQGFITAWHNFWFPGGMPLGLTPYDCFDHGVPGPGASVGAKGYDFYTKFFAGPLTYYQGSNLGSWYTRWTERSDFWRRAEETRARTYGPPVSVLGSTLFTVPKKREISRTANTEASLAMFAQRGAGVIIENRLLDTFNIDLSSQPDVNRELTLLGSCTGRFVTLDLSSASNFPKGMFEQVTPKYVVNALRKLRAPAIRLPESEQFLPLHIYSTMGNGFTFPLETALFAAVVASCYFFRGISLQRNAVKKVPNFGVFGDDIIVVTEAERDVRRLLEILGFKVNEEKSCSAGPFRESCGYDAFLGSNVRGVYCKRLSSYEDRVILLNQLLEWSFVHKIPIPKTVGYLYRSLERVRWVPLWEGLDTGLRIHLDAIPPTFQRPRYNWVSGKWTYQCSVPISAELVYDFGAIFEPINRFDRRDRVSSGRFRVDSEPILVNQDGLAVALLGGYLDSGFKPILQKSRAGKRQKRENSLKWTVRLPGDRTTYRPQSRSTSLWNLAGTPAIIGVEDAFGWWVRILLEDTAPPSELTSPIPQ